MVGENKIKKSTILLILGLICLNAILLIVCIVILGNYYRIEYRETNPKIAIEELPSSYSIEEAIVDQCVVIQKINSNNYITYGAEQWLTFLTSDEVEKFVRIVSYNGESLEVRDLFYKDEKYTLKQRLLQNETQEVSYLNLFKIRKTEMETEIEYIYCLGNDLEAIMNSSINNIYRIKESIWFTVPKTGDFSRYQLLDEIDMTTYTAQMAKTDGCVVIENGVMTNGASLLLSYINEEEGKSFIRIANYQDGILLSCSHISRDISRENGIFSYEFIGEDGTIQEEMYQYFYLYYDAVEKGMVYVFSNKELTYETWSMYYRDDIPGGIRKVLFYRTEQEERL